MSLFHLKPPKNAQKPLRSFPENEGKAVRVYRLSLQTQLLEAPPLSSANRFGACCAVKPTRQMSDSSMFLYSFLRLHAKPTR